MCEALLIRKVGLVHATQDITIGLYKQTCKILLPVALCDSILVPDLRMSLVNGGSNVVVSVILRLTAGVWPLSYRDLDALTNGLRFRILQSRRLDQKKNVLTHRKVDAQLYMAQEGNKKAPQ